jgi:enamine deaminase RidA (YjgF/YER057c/UK114 family)
VEKIALLSKRLPPPDGPFSHGVKVGNLVFLAGQAAVDQEGRVVGKGDIEAQTTQTLENLQLVLEAAGATFDDVATITVYLTNILVSAARRIAIRSPLQATRHDSLKVGL